MTRERALEILINRFVVRAKVTDYDYDPAGSTTSYIPNPDDVATLEAVLDHKLSEGDFYFSVGCGSTPSRYALRSEIVGAALKGQVSEVEKARSEERAETARKCAEAVAGERARCIAICEKLYRTEGTDLIYYIENPD